MIKKNVLFILHLPNPVHGASVVGSMIKESDCINKQLNCEYIQLSTVPQKLNVFFISKLYNFFKLLYNVGKALMKKKFDLVYLTPCATGLPFYKDFIVSCIVKLFHKGKIVYHFHNQGVKTNEYVPEVIKRLFFRRSKVILISRFLYPDIESYVNSSNVLYCPNGLKESKHIEERKYNNKCYPVVLFLSNMIETKGIYDFIDAIKILESKTTNFSVTIAGAWYSITETEFWNNVEAKDIKVQINHMGPVYGVRKQEIFQQADIFVFPSHNETFGLVLLEAMQEKCAVVASRVGGIPEIIEHGENGILVNPKDSVAIASAIEALIISDQERSRIGTNGYKTLHSKFTYQKFEDNFIDTINEILDRSS